MGKKPKKTKATNFKFPDLSNKHDCLAELVVGTACNSPAGKPDRWKGRINRVHSPHKSQTNYFPASSTL